MDLERYVHPDYFYRTIPQLWFLRPEPESENQETIPSSFSASKLYIRLHCTTIHHVLNVIGGYQRRRYEGTQVQSRVCVSSEAIERDLVTVLLNWEVPEDYHENIVRSIVEQVSLVIPCLDCPASWPTLTECLLRVDIRFNNFYFPDLQWLFGTLGNVEDERDENEYDGMVPASESAIKSLVVRKWKREAIQKEKNEEESSNCSICLEFIVGSEIGSLPCSHMFHHDCIIHWLRKSHYCPLCRFKMPTANSLALAC